MGPPSGGRRTRTKNQKRSLCIHILLRLATLLVFDNAYLFADGWQPSPSHIYSRFLSLESRSASLQTGLFARCVKNKAASSSSKETAAKDRPSYTISYSPNFQRHIVSSITKTVTAKSNVTKMQKTVVRSFEWLDEAQKAYPTATLEYLSPPPPSFLQQEMAAQSQTNEEEAVLFSRIVAGAGAEETSVYYKEKGSTYVDEKTTTTTTTLSTNPNNGGSYLLKFLQKFYSALPTITPAEIHRGVLNKFPKLALYDSAFVHERLFFLLAPLPPGEVLAQLKLKSTAAGTTETRKAKEKQEDSWEDGYLNVTSCFDDFPLLFYKYGYGAGLTQSQLVQALQSLPQFWLPVYLGDACVASKRPQDILPYVMYHLSSHPEALSDTNSQLDPLLTGVVQADVASLAHAKSALGLTWDQCRLLLLALPSLRTCEVEPNWEMYLRGPVRSTLIEDSLIFLRLRLQLDPLQVFALIKTHTRVSNYRVFTRLKSILDALQTELELDSEELKLLILRMPSLLGMSEASLLSHIQFFTEEVGLTSKEFKKSVMRFPALLQYSLVNLTPKLSFFRNELGISQQESLVKITSSTPTLWGLSLEKNLRPKAESLGNFCDFSLKEVGEMVECAPEILSLNWKGNLEPTLQFLTERLALSSPQLSSIIKASPRILAQSIHRSLEYKIALLEEHILQGKGGTESVTQIILERPSLLVTSKAQLIKSLQKMPKGRQLGKKTIVQTSMDGEVVNAFASVAEAAVMAGICTSQMYKVLREGRTCREMKYSYAYGNRSSADSRPTSKKKTKAKSTLMTVNEDSSLSVYVSGRIWPPDGAFQNRGLRRAGGMAINIPNLPESLSEDVLRSAFDECCKGQILATRKSDKHAGEWLVLLGYAYLRPSRRRASLYICLVVLRVLTQVYLLAGKNEATDSNGLDGNARKTLAPVPTSIRIVTDSNYVYELLQQAGNLLDWGSKTTLTEFIHTEKGSDWAANPDILYPISRTYSGLLNPMGPTPPSIRANLTICFGHVAEGANQVSSSTLRDNMGEWAAEAAERQYKRSFAREKSL